LWLMRRAANAKGRGEGYGEDADAPALDDPATTPRAGVASADALAQPADRPAFSGRAFALAIAPVVLVIALNYVLATWLFPSLDTAYLTEPRFGATHINNLRGIWAVIGALSAAIVLLLVLQRQHLTALVTTLEAGATSSVLPLLNTAS